MFCCVSLVFVCIFGFLEGFCWLCKNLRENQTNKKNISKGGSETFKKPYLLVFPKVFLVFFGCLLYCWFSRKVFVGFVKTFGKTKQTKKTNQYPRVGLKPLKTLFFLFSLCFFFVFFVGFRLYVWFYRRFFGFVKTFGKTNKNKNKQTHIQGWV